LARIKPSGYERFTVWAHGSSEPANNNHIGNGSIHFLVKGSGQGAADMHPKWVGSFKKCIRVCRPCSFTRPACQAEAERLGLEPVWIHIDAEPNKPKFFPLLNNFLSDVCCVASPPRRGRFLHRGVLVFILQHEPGYFGRGLPIHLFFFFSLKSKRCVYAPNTCPGRAVDVADAER
jgi:hypothetical protein